MTDQPIFLPDELRQLEEARAETLDRFVGPERYRSHQGPPNGPDVVCIGAQKSTTTWLQFNLSNHPFVFLPAVKELFYLSSRYFRNFDDYYLFVREQIEQRRLEIERDMLEEHRGPIYEQLDWIGREERDDAWYTSIFANARAFQATMEIDPTLGLAPRVGIRHLLGLSPGLKAIVIIRDPADRALSQMMMDTNGALPKAFFEEEVARFPHSMYHYFSDYPTWITRWAGMLAPGNLCAINLSEVKERPHEVLRRVCAFIGVPYDSRFFPRAAEARLRGSPPPRDLTEERDVLKTAMGGIYGRRDFLREATGVEF